MTKKTNGFSFKRFHVAHDRCAMKVGTDGILLGAWADITGAERILDLGTGTGLLALMLAQRSADNTQISAVEIDQAAFLQAQENVCASPWAEKIRLYQQDIVAFGLKCGQNLLRFDRVIANPPYFARGVDCSSVARNQARYTMAQTHADWLHTAANCVAETGKIHFILPFGAGKRLLESTALYCTKYCEVLTKVGKPPARILLEFSPLPAKRQFGQIIIYDENNQYHQSFISLTEDFYLNF